MQDTFDPDTVEALGVETVTEWKEWFQSKGLSLRYFLEQFAPDDKVVLLARLQTDWIDPWLYAFLDSPEGHKASLSFIPKKPREVKKAYERYEGCGTQEPVKKTVTMHRNSSGMTVMTVSSSDPYTPQSPSAPTPINLNDYSPGKFDPAKLKVVNDEVLYFDDDPEFSYELESDGHDTFAYIFLTHPYYDNKWGDDKSDQYTFHAGYIWDKTDPEERESVTLSGTVADQIEKDLENFGMEEVSECLWEIPRSTKQQVIDYFKNSPYFYEA